MTIGLGHYLSVGAILFTLGIFGIFLNRKNVIIILNPQFVGSDLGSTSVIPAYDGGGRSLLAIHGAR